MPDLNIFDLTGQVALITGGNGGIGLGMARGLASAGATVEIWGRNSDRNTAAVNELKAHGVEATQQQVDVSDEAEVVAGVRALLERHGRLDTVIANAGVMGSGQAFIETTTEDWCATTAVNLDGVFWVLREAVKHMVARADCGDPGGSLIVTSSTASLHGVPRNQAYASTKAAVNALVRSIAVEHARHGIRANSVLPGWFRSEMTGHLQTNDKFNEKAIGRVPLRRWGEVDELAGIAVYLASRASSYHTGDIIVVDGGYTIF